MADTRNYPRPTGRTLKLYLVDGTPSGLITAELGVSSLKAAVASRTALPDLLRREESGRTGIYVLLGADPDAPGRSLVDVGEGDQVRTRLAAHDGDENTDFFTRAVLVVSKDENLTKAHGRYLESRVIATIRASGRAKLVNATEPVFKGLPEAEIADMERVLIEIDVLLPLLGFDILRPVGQELPTEAFRSEGATKPQSFAAQEGPIFTFNESNTDAKAREAGGEFVILTGSKIRRDELQSCPFAIKQHRQELITGGILVPSLDGKYLQFTRDIAFGSPSAAGAMVVGTSINGRKYWRHAATKQSYADWRAAMVDGSQPLNEQKGFAT